MVEREYAETTLEYLAKFEYAFRALIVLALEWYTLLCRGAVWGLGLNNWYPSNLCLEDRYRLGYRSA